MKRCLSRLAFFGFTLSLCACATPASVDLTKEKANQLERQQDEQKQEIKKMNEEKQQEEKQKMQEEIDKLKKQ